jgi:hypothetical protein
MRTFVPTGVGMLALVALLGPTPASTATMCADVESAKVALNKHAAAGADSRAAARSQDVQSPRGNDVQAPRSNEVQAPRNQDLQAPRSNDVQAPRSNDVQAPRNQDLQAPRDQDVQSPRGGAATQRGAQASRSPEYREAATLVKEAEAACQAGNTTVASEKARAAMARLPR